MLNICTHKTKETAIFLVVNINNISNLRNRLVDYKKTLCEMCNCSGEEEQQDPPTKYYLLLPYCNEKAKYGMSWVDWVNAPQIDRTVLGILRDIFGARFRGQPPVRKGRQLAASPASNEVQFLAFLKRGKFMGEKKTAVIVTHSSFLTAFSKLLQGGGKKIVFENLDILQVVIKNGRVKKASVLRYCYAYRAEGEVEGTMAVDPAAHTYFLVRHCPACHNLAETTLLEKSGRGGAGRGFGRWSMCLKATINELISVAHPLKEILKNYSRDKKNLSDILFGSSVVFRAILTSILLREILLSSCGNQKRPSVTNCEHITPLSARLPGGVSMVEPERPPSLPTPAVRPVLQTLQTLHRQ